jgi:broad specificity phosphatase PhoE
VNRTLHRDWPGSKCALSVLLLTMLVSVPVPGQRAPARTRSALRIYLARHGQTDWNLEGRTQGSRDIPLNATGRQQAEQLKRRLDGVQIDAVYASTLRRSRETADIAHGRIPVTSLQGLAERHFGKFEGRLTNDPETGPEFEKRMWSPEDSLDGGESLSAFRERVRAALDTIRKAHSSGSVLIVGHSYTNRMILSVLFNLTVEQMRSFDQVNDELYLIELESGSLPHLWKLITETNLKDL